MGYFYPDGLSSHPNAYSLLKGPIWLSNPPKYISSIKGDASNDGRTPNMPADSINTLTYSAGAFVILMDGHEETFTGQYTINSGVTVVGETSSGGEPTAKLTPPAATSNMFTPFYIGFANILIKPETVSNSSSTILFLGALGGGAFDCVFEDNNLNHNPSYAIDDDNGLLVRCTFRSVATSIATRPDVALQIGDSGFAGDNCYLEDVVFDDGAFGRTDNCLEPIASRANWRFHGLSLLNGARADFYSAQTVTGVCGVGAASRGGSVLNYGGEVSLSGTLPLRKDLFVAMTEVDGAIYVDSANGDDTETSPYSSERPLATLAAAAAFLTTNTLLDKLVVVAEGHSETVTTTVNFDQAGTTVLGGANCKITVGADTTGIKASGTGVFICGLQIYSSVALGATSYLLHTAGYLSHVHNCDLYCSGDIGGAGLYIGNTTDLKEVKLFGTGSSVSDRPEKGISTNSSSGHFFRGVTVDGGTYGFESYGIEVTGGSNLHGMQVNCTNGADIRIEASTGYLRADVDESCTVEAFV